MRPFTNTLSIAALAGAALLLSAGVVAAQDLKQLDAQLAIANKAMGEGSGVGTEEELSATDCASANANEEALDTMSAGLLTGNDPGSAAQATAIVDSPGLSDCLSDLSLPTLPE